MYRPDSRSIECICRYMTLTTTHIESLEHCNVEGEELQWDDCEDTLDAVYRAWHRDATVGALQRLLVTGLADNDWAALWQAGGEE